MAGTGALALLVLGRYGLHTLMVLKHGYAVFLPNPRGSSGRGQDFTRLVKGDMNGADESVLVTYPEEGHGVRRFPTIFDYAARIVSWFDGHMRA